jgi:hypothetical protein
LAAVDRNSPWETDMASGRASTGRSALSAVQRAEHSRSSTASVGVAAEQRPPSHSAGVQDPDAMEKAFQDLL